MKQNNSYEDQVRELNVKLQEQNEHETKGDTNEGGSTDGRWRRGKRRIMESAS